MFRINFSVSALETSLRLLFKSGHRSSQKLSSRERGIFDSLFARYIAYVNPANRLPAKLPLGPHFEADARAGLANDPDQPNETAKQIYLNWLEDKRTHLGVHGPKCSVARRTDHKWEDRLVLNGFNKFIEFLARDVDIRHRSVARHVHWPKPSNRQSKPIFIRPDSVGVTPDSPTNASYPICVVASEYTGENCPLVSSRGSTKYYLAKFCLVTVPVGVLKGLDRRSAIQFHPPLPSRKRLAIARLAIPSFGAETHNKVGTFPLY